MAILFLVLYYMFLSHIKYRLERQLEVNNATIQKNKILSNPNSYVKEQIIDELEKQNTYQVEGNYQNKYIYLFPHIQ